MGRYRIEHDRPNCIGCAACAAVAPDFWEMNADGKSDCKGAQKQPDGTENLDMEDSQLDANRAAADSCPVNVIHIRDKEKNERVI